MDDDCMLLPTFISSLFLFQSLAGQIKHLLTEHDSQHLSSFLLFLLRDFALADGLHWRLHFSTGGHLRLKCFSRFGSVIGLSVPCWLELRSRGCYIYSPVVWINQKHMLTFTRLLKCPLVWRIKVCDFIHLTFIFIVGHLFYENL